MVFKQEFLHVAARSETCLALACALALTPSCTLSLFQNTSTTPYICLDFWVSLWEFLSGIHFPLKAT